MRINKYIASTGGYSRRSAEKLIQEGKVTLNGKVVTNLATDVNEKKDKLAIEGKQVNLINKKIYIMLHKPKGYITTTSDEKGRKTVMDFLPDYLKRVVKPIGRLDRDTEGLLLFTNDGDLARELTLPSSEIKKHYQVTIEGTITKEEIETITKSVEIISNGKKIETKPAEVRIKEENLEAEKPYTKLELVITEGKNREVRQIMEKINKTIILLKRTQIGALTLGGLPRGKYKDFEPKYVTSSPKTKK